MKRKLLLLLLLCFGAVAQAQRDNQTLGGLGIERGKGERWQWGGIEGLVTDGKGEPMMTAPVRVIQDGILKGEFFTDIDGRFLVKPLSVGRYDIEVSFEGYISELIHEVAVVDSFTTSLRVVLERARRKLFIGPPQESKSLELQTIKVGSPCTIRLFDDERRQSRALPAGSKHIPIANKKGAIKPLKRTTSTKKLKMGKRKM